jgi:precorrin-6Y C5,15-methyltransferase (decarboxylating)
MSIHIIGMGMGNTGTLTAETLIVLERSDVIIGAERLLRSMPALCSAQKHAAISTDEIMQLINNNPTNSICVLMSGDTGFYSGAAKLLERLGTDDVTVLPGISSVQYFASRLRRLWQDWKLVSAHGKMIDIARVVCDNSETFFLTGGELNIQTLCMQLTAGGFGALRVTVGENLGGDGEHIKTDTAEVLAQKAHAPLAVMLVDNPTPGRRVSCGFADDLFIRGGTPMTKSEVRSVILSKLQLHDNDIVYDIGAGTGSVSVEAALLSRSGSVFAFERTQEGCRLIRENAEKFGASNITVVAGEALSSFSKLPAPDAAFIGGSGGNLRDILEALLLMNPKVRLVVSAVTLETLSEATVLFAGMVIQGTEIVQLSVSRAKLMGAHHLMTAQNPVFIISGTGGND